MISFAALKAYLWVLPYALIALCVAAIFYYRADGATAHAANKVLQTEINGLVATNDQQQKTIVALAEIAKAKDAIVSDLADKVAAINKTVIDTNKAFSDLVTNDPDVKDFTARPVPDSLKRMHNKP